MSGTRSANRPQVPKPRPSQVVGAAPAPPPEGGGAGEGHCGSAPGRGSADISTLHPLLDAPPFAGATPAPSRPPARINSGTTRVYPYLTLVTPAGLAAPDAGPPSRPTRPTRPRTTSTAPRRTHRPPALSPPSPPAPHSLSRAAVQPCSRAVLPLSPRQLLTSSQIPPPVKLPLPANPHPGQSPRSAIERSLARRVPGGAEAPTCTCPAPHEAHPTRRQRPPPGPPHFITTAG